MTSKLSKEEQFVRKLIDKCLAECNNKKCLFRGHPKEYALSSTLYRKYEALDIGFNNIEENIVDGARHLFPSSSSNIEILTELRHYGQELNLIDFSYDLYVALFFACQTNQPDKGDKPDKDDEPTSKDGRLVNKNGKLVNEDGN